MHSVYSYGVLRSGEPKNITKAIAYLTGTRNRAPAGINPEDDSPVLHDFLPGVAAAYAIEVASDSFELVRYADIKAAWISEYELARMGFQNVVTRAVANSLTLQKIHDIYAVLMGGTFEASLMLLHNMWEQNFRKWVKGDYAVAFPDRSMLSFCDASSRQGMAQLRMLIDHAYATSDDPLSPHIYIRRDGRWHMASS